MVTLSLINLMLGVPKPSPVLLKGTKRRSRTFARFQIVSYGGLGSINAINTEFRKVAFYLS